jgi:heme exporter protein D
MEFDSIVAFWAMEGHGPYVWACYAVFIVCLVGLMVWSMRQRREVISSQRRQAGRTSARQSAARQASAAASFTPVQPSRD